MFKENVVVDDCVPDTPVIVTLYVPEGAELDAVSVSVLPVDVDMGFGEKAAVTPLGRPVADNSTLPLNPY
jgi:hypothetical protein